MEIDPSSVADRAGNAVDLQALEYLFEVKPVDPVLQGDNADLVFVIDVSGSTDNEFEGSPVGDVNSDGKANTILDAQLASILVLNQELVGLGLASTTRVAVVPFSDSATIFDLDPIAEGVQAATSLTADVDGNGIADIEQVLRGLSFGGGTDFSDGLDLAISVFDTLETPNGNGNLIFLSDGSGGGGFASQLQTLTDRGVQIRAFGVGGSADINSLREMDPFAELVLSTDDFLSRILQL